MPSHAGIPVVVSGPVSDVESVPEIDAASVVASVFVSVFVFVPGPVVGSEVGVVSDSVTVAGVACDIEFDSEPTDPSVTVAEPGPAVVSVAVAGIAVPAVVPL